MDGNIITGQGAGATLEFAYTILKAIGKDADALKESMLYV